MKKIIVIAILLFSVFSYSQTKDSVLCIQSKQKFVTNYMVQTAHQKYYIDFLTFTLNKTVKIIEYNRNGTVRNCTEFELSEVKIYKSKK